MALIDRVAGLTGSVGIKAPCVVATTAAITLSGLQTIDGVTVASGDRVLVKNQVDTTTNGIYAASSGAWSRTEDFDGARDVVSGTMVFVRSGTTNGNQIWKASATDPVTVGTSALSFSYAVTFAGISISAFVLTLLDDANAAAFLTTLGVSSFIQSLLDDADAATARTTLGITGATIAWADVASATTTDIGAQASENLRITGTTTITGLGTVASGTTRNLRFAGALTFTHNATSLILPGGANITTAADDRCTAKSLGSGNWIITSYTKASGKPNALLGTGDISATGTPSSTTFWRGDNTWSAPTGGFTASSPQTPSGVTSVTFSSIPSTAKLIIISLANCSFLGGVDMILQLGDSGGLETSGYSGDTGASSTGALVALASSGACYGNIILSQQDASTNTWAISVMVNQISGPAARSYASVKSTSATMDRVALLCSGTLSATKLNLIYA